MVCGWCVGDVWMMIICGECMMIIVFALLYCAHTMYVVSYTYENVWRFIHIHHISYTHTCIIHVYMHIPYMQITVSGMSSGSNSALNISGHGLIVRSVRACNSIFHIMAGDFFYEDLPPQVCCAGVGGAVCWEWDVHTGWDVHM